MAITISRDIRNKATLWHENSFVWNELILPEQCLIHYYSNDNLHKSNGKVNLQICPFCLTHVDDLYTFNELTFVGVIFSVEEVNFKNLLILFKLT